MSLYPRYLITHSIANPDTGTYNSHTFAKQGSQDLTCGTALYEIVVEDGPNPDAPYVEGKCTIDVHLDAWDGDADKESPFWLHIDSMKDADGNSLEPTDEWVRIPPDLATPSQRCRRLKFILHPY